MAFFCRLPCKIRHTQDSPPPSSKRHTRRKSLMSPLKRNKSSDKLPESSHHEKVAAQRSASDNPLPNSDELWESLLSMFPNICPDYVRKEYRGLRKKYGAGFDEQHLINTITERPGYPKKLDPSDLVPGNLEESGGPKRVRAYRESAVKILRVDYPNVPSTYVKTAVREKGTLYRAHLALHDAECMYCHIPDRRPYQRLRKREYVPADMPSIDRVRLDKSCRGVLLRELELARERRMESTDHEENGDFNDQETMECQCCYSDCPMNLMISCTGREPHFFCPICVRTYAETKIGVMGFELKCMYTTDCDSSFSKRKLEGVLGTILSDRLADTQQQREIHVAGVEGLEDCPFCDFKAIAPPVDQDRQFACQNPTCRKVSCRLCNRKSHVPRRCEEVEKDEHNTARQIIEEAMTSAVVRRCTCMMPIIKEDGCNKMRCPRCSRVFCYVCRTEIFSYDHFGDGKGNGCTLYDVSTSAAAVHNKHDVEAADARDRATRQALDVNPDLNEEQIEMAGPELPDHHHRLHRHSPARSFDSLLDGSIDNGANHRTQRQARIPARDHRLRLALRHRAEIAAGTFEPPWFMTDVPPNAFTARARLQHPRDPRPHAPDVPLPPDTGPGSYRPPWRLTRTPPDVPRRSFHSPPLPGSPVAAPAFGEVPRYQRVLAQNPLSSVRAA